MTQKTERLVACLLLAFFAWCYGEFQKANKAYERDIKTITMLVDAANMDQESHEICAQYTEKTREVFGMPDGK